MKKEKVNPDTHSIFPMYRMVEETVIPALDDETLFFIFYFQQVGWFNREQLREVPCSSGAQEKRVAIPQEVLRVVQAPLLPSGHDRAVRKR
jgi:hypothetical protein